MSDFSSNISNSDSRINDKSSRQFRCNMSLIPDCTLEIEKFFMTDTTGISFDSNLLF